MRRATPTWMYALVVVVIGCIGFGSYKAWWSDDDDAPRPASFHNENREDVRREIREAFRDPKTNVEVPAGVKELFEIAGTQLGAGGARIDEYFDADRMATELNRNGALDRIGIGPRNPAVYQNVKRGLMQGLPRAVDVLTWEATEFRALRWIQPDREAVLIVRHRATIDEEVVLYKIRWWIVRTDTGWRFYDFEDVLIGGRFSSLMSLVVNSLAARDPDQIMEARRFGQDFLRAKRAIMESRFAEAEEILQVEVPEYLPDKVRALFYLWRSLVQASQGKSDEALASIELAEKLDRDIPAIEYIKAVAYSLKEESEQVLIHSQRFLDQIGPDDIVLLHQAGALEQLERLEEARQVYGRALDENPSSYESLSGLRRCLDPKDKTEFVNRFFKLPKPQEHFGRFVNEAMGDDDLEAATALIAAYGKRFPDDVEAVFQDARLRARLGKLDEARPLFLAAIDKAALKERTTYLNGFLGAMAEKGKGQEAYAAVKDADAVAAFRYLADELLYADEDDMEKPNPIPLEKLIAVHRKRQPDDPQLNYYAAELRFRSKDYEEVERLLAAAMAKKLEMDELHRYRWLRVQALYKSGKGLVAYDKVGPAQDTFAQLANSYRDDKDTKGLDALIAAHRKAEPKDTDLAYWKGEAHFMRADYKDAVKEFEEYRRERAENDRDYDWQVRDRLVRALIRLKRFADARKELERDAKSYEFSLLRAAIPAAAGDVAKTEQVLDEFAQKKWGPAAFYVDPDLGPALRSEPFAKLRDKYPPPKDERPLKKT